MSKTSIAALAATLLSGFAAAQNTWYVDERATPPFEGSQARPFAALDQAIADADTLAGDTLIVAPGTYRAFETFKRLAIRSSEGPLVTGIAPEGASTTALFHGAAYDSTLEGFTVWGPDGGTAVRGEGLALRRCMLLGLRIARSGFVDCSGGEAQHCLISGFEFGLDSFGACAATARNTILRANDHDIVGDAYFCVYGSTAPWSGTAFSSIQGNPQLVDFPGHDFHPLPGSPCIDAGDPAAPLDPDGTRADIGPLPFDPTYEPHTVYCTAKVNSLGCTPSIQATNTASVSSPRPFWIRCTNQINQRVGLMSYGFAPKAAPYQGGYLCIEAPTHRTHLLDSGGNLGAPDCSGVFVLNFTPIVQAGTDPSLTLGQDVFCQFWARDPGSSASTNRSDALHFRIAP
jgi:hypothetical protein